LILLIQSLHIFSKNGNILRCLGTSDCGELAERKVLVTASCSITGSYTNVIDLGQLYLWKKILMLPFKNTNTFTIQTNCMLCSSIRGFETCWQR